MCNPAWHPIWRAVGRDARVREPGKVYAIFCALRDEGERASLLTAPILQAGLGGRVETIERILSALSVHNLIDEANTVTEHGHAVTRDVTLSRVTSRYVTLGENIDELDDDEKVERSRRLARERQARKRARDRAQNVTLVTAPIEEKEDDHDHLLSNEGAREPSANAPLAYQRKQGWVTSVMRRAEEENLLSTVEAAELWRGIMLLRPDSSLPNWGLPRRVNDELDRLDKVLKERAGPQPAAAVQPELLMSISNNRDHLAVPTARLSAQDILEQRQRRQSA